MTTKDEQAAFASEGIKGAKAGETDTICLDSWKAIANYLNRDVRTVQRWETLEGLPIHRHLHHPETNWGRIIFHVADVDASWNHLKQKGFNPDRPRNASWGERYFHMLDPDGHELSFARPTVLYKL